MCVAKKVCAASACSIFYHAVECNWRTPFVYHPSRIQWILAVDNCACACIVERTSGWIRIALVSISRSCSLYNSRKLPLVIDFCWMKVRHSLLRSPINESVSVVCTMLYTTIIHSAPLCFFFLLLSMMMMMMMNTTKNIFPQNQGLHELAKNFCRSLYLSLFPVFSFALSIFRSLCIPFHCLY